MYNPKTQARSGKPKVRANPTSPSKTKTKAAKAKVDPAPPSKSKAKVDPAPPSKSKAAKAKQAAKAKANPSRPAKSKGENTGSANAALGTSRVVSASLVKAGGGDFIPPKKIPKSTPPPDRRHLVLERQNLPSLLKEPSPSQLFSVR